MVGPSGPRSSEPHLVVVLHQADDLRSAVDGHAELAGPLLEQQLRAALGHDQQLRVAAGQDPEVERRARRGRHALHAEAAGQEPVGEAARVQQLQRAGVHGERAGEVRLLGPPLEHRTAHAGQCELARQRQAGRPGTHDRDIDVVHLGSP